MTAARPVRRGPARISVALLFTVLAGHACAQEQPSPAAPVASQAPAPAGDAAVRSVDSSALGACVRRQPPYPTQALRNDEQGRSLLAFTVTPAGAIQEAVLLRSSGHRLLDDAALAHLNKCIASRASLPDDPLPPGRYVLPMVWRIE